MAFKINLDKIRKEKAALAKRQAERGMGMLKIPEGEHLLRFLPPWSEEGKLVKEVVTHYGIVEHGVTCLAQFDEACPGCEMVDKLRESGNKQDADLARRMAPKSRYLANVHVVKSEGMEEGRVGVLAFGETILQKLLDIISDPDYGDITDTKNGRNVKVIRRGTGAFDTEYDVIARPKTCATEADLSKMKDLDKLVEALKVDADRMVGMLEGKSEEELDAEAAEKGEKDSDEEDDDEDRSAKPKRVTSREEEPEEEGEEEESEDEEEESEDEEEESEEEETEEEESNEEEEEEPSKPEPKPKKLSAAERIAEIKARAAKKRKS
jgi:hypothetical protein